MDPKKEMSKYLKFLNDLASGPLIVGRANDLLRAGHDTPQVEQRSADPVQSTEPQRRDFVQGHSVLRFQGYKPSAMRHLHALW